MSTRHDRDQSIDRLLRQSVRSGAGSATPGACPDGELLAAWAEGSLGKSNLATIEAHMADCPRCQEIGAVLAKAPAAAPATERRWQWGVALRWLAPLAAGATAVALWVAIPDRDSRRVSIDSSQSTVDSRESIGDSPRPALESPRSIAEGPQPLAGGPEATRDRRALPEPAQAPAVPRPEERAAGAAAGRLQASPPAEEPRQADALAERRDAATVPAASSTERDRNVALPSAVAPSAAPERSAAVPSAPAASAAQVAGARNEAFALAREATTLAPVVVVSPTPSIRWRLGAAGLVEYSSDGGSTWERLSTGVTADLLAGASPSPSVCWVVGRAATVLLTTNGRLFSRVTFPADADLVAVRATDARTVVVTAADGRTFRTSDGGLTWTP